MFRKKSRSWDFDKNNLEYNIRMYVSRNARIPYEFKNFTVSQNAIYFIPLTTLTCKQNLQEFIMKSHYLAYVLYEEQLFYVEKNINNEICINLNLNKYQIQDIYNTFVPNNIALIKNHEIDLVTKIITGLTRKEHQDRILHMEKKIKEANLNDSIFDDLNCPMYLLYLFENNKISKHEYLFVEILTLAKMQYTEEGKKWLKEKDKIHCSKNTEITLIQLNEIIDKIIAKVKYSFFDLHPYLQFNEKKFKNGLIKLNVLDKTIIKIKIPSGKFNDNEGFINYAIKYTQLSLSDDEFYYIYSPGLIDYILESCINDYPIKMAPIFGNINEHTLFTMRQNGFHPINLYSNKIEANPESVHKYKVGVLSVALHDLIFHLSKSNLMNKNDYDFTYKVFIPTLGKSSRFTSLSHSNSALTRLIDFNLTELHHNSYKKRVIIKDPSEYLRACMKIGIQVVGSKKKDRQVIFQEIYNANEKNEQHKIDLNKFFSHDYF